MSDSIEDMGGFPHWRFNELAHKADMSLMPITLAIVWVLVALVVGFGARLCGWVGVWFLFLRYLVAFKHKWAICK